MKKWRSIVRSDDGHLENFIGPKRTVENVSNCEDEYDGRNGKEGINALLAYLNLSPRDGGKKRVSLKFLNKDG